MDTKNTHQGRNTHVHDSSSVQVSGQKCNMKAREISLSLWLSATDRWFSPGPLVSSTNKTDRHDITEIVLKVALNTIKQTNNKLH